MVNKVILVGNVGADPEIRTFEDGNKVARLTLATTERVFNPKTQERTDRTEWHRLVIWRGLATVVEQYVRKGSQLYIEGKIRTNEWTDANGQKRYGTEIIVDNLNMLGRKGDNSQNQGGQYQTQGAPIGQGQPMGQQQMNQQPFGQPPMGQGQPVGQQPTGGYQPQQSPAYEPHFNQPTPQAQPQGMYSQPTQPYNVESTAIEQDDDLPF